MKENGQATETEELKKRKAKKDQQDTYDDEEMPRDSELQSNRLIKESGQ